MTGLKCNFTMMVDLAHDLSSPVSRRPGFISIPTSKLRSWRKNKSQENVPAKRQSLNAASGRDWRGAGRRKRLLLAVVHDDSTVSYYLMHEGIVKPRQN
ncbi:putative tRNA-splicing endonuclease subunit tsp-1 [Colletotrichum fructicola]|nr:putative tRNA-splicing endonuclease subunit tsp-1 [Colletotrichum fructicola]KAF4923423.1 putative tRNA-splicing endonuclease subunit tsp-1 [Colletotrichum fructicola]